MFRQRSRNRTHNEPKHGHHGAPYPPSHTGDYFSRDRLENFIDGVFVIIITLLVLRIEAPALDESDLTLTLDAFIDVFSTHIAPRIHAWVVSFLVLAGIYLKLTRIMDLIRCIDRGVFWWVMFVLLWSSFIPFPSLVLGQHVHSPVAQAFFGLNLIIVTGAFTAIKVYAYRNPDVLHDHVKPKTLLRDILISYLTIILGYGVGIALAWVSPFLTMTVFAAMSLLLLREPQGLGRPNPS